MAQRIRESYVLTFEEAEAVFSAMLLPTKTRVVQFIEWSRVSGHCVVIAKSMYSWWAKTFTHPQATSTLSPVRQNWEPHPAPGGGALSSRIPWSLFADTVHAAIDELLMFDSDSEARSASERLRDCRCTYLAGLLMWIAGETDRRPAWPCRDVDRNAYDPAAIPPLRDALARRAPAPREQQPRPKGACMCANPVGTGKGECPHEMLECRGKPTRRVQYQGPVCEECYQRTLPRLRLK